MRLLIAIALAVLLAGCTTPQGAPVKVTGSYTVQAITAETKSP